MVTTKMHDLYSIDYASDHLGEGNFGTTYKCTHIYTGVQYACKIISKFSLITPKKRESLEREIDTLRLISLKENPYIVSFKDVLEDECDVFIVMEICKGETLFDRLSKCNGFEEAKARQLIKQIISAVEACHSFGIVHRDLKLENLIFETKCEDSALKLIDFGLADYFELGKELTDFAGSLSYIAPEVAEGHYGPKADIWSVGVLLYALLSKMFPFKVNSSEDINANIFKDKKLFAHYRWQSVSEGAKDFIQRMLNCNVNERFSATELLEHPWIQGIV